LKKALIIFVNLNKIKLENADLTYLHSMADGDDKLIMEMIDIFVEQAREMWVQMQESLDKKDFVTLGRLAHKAKSSLAIMGMETTAQRLKELEVYCGDNKHTELYQDIINIFKAECQLAIVELLAYKNDSLMHKN
jgi:HPt (histidine-containing phosphotransfer) domain-containing protein